MAGRKIALKFLLPACIILLIVLLSQHELNIFSPHNSFIKQPAMGKTPTQTMELSTTSSSGKSSSGTLSGGASSGGTSSSVTSASGTSSGGSLSGGASSGGTSSIGTYISPSGTSLGGTSSSGASSSGTSSGGSLSGGASSGGTSPSGSLSSGASSGGTSSTGTLSSNTSLSGPSSIDTSRSRLFSGDYINNILKSESKAKTWLVVYWSTYLGRRLDMHKKWLEGDCPVPCELTSDISRAKEADAFVVFARAPRPLPPIESVPWILQIRENPVYTPILKDRGFMSKFNLLKSYRLDSDFPDPTILLPDLTPPIPFKSKTGLIMVAVSHCEPVRTEYIRQLMTFVQVDSYGACLKNTNGLKARYYKENGTTMFKQLKTKLARNYKFTLVFFNQDCDYFVDDQLTHAWNAGSVPVVMSTDKLDDFLPGNLKHSVIKVRDFKSPKHLADYLKRLSSNENMYSKYLEWKWKGYGNITGTVIGDFWKPKYPLYCQICVALSEGRVHEDGLKPIPCNPRRFKDWGITKGD